MKEVTTVGLDIATHAFQVHGVDQDGNAVNRPLIAIGCQARNILAGVMVLFEVFASC